MKAWAAFDNVLLTGATEFHARVASTSDVASLEIRLDAMDGQVVSQLKIPNTGEFQKWANVSAPITHTDGEHTLYLLFLGEPGPLFGIQYFELTPAAPVQSKAHGAIEVTYAMGCTVAGAKDSAEFANATSAASDADVALVFVGSDEQVSTEALDRYSIYLPGAQNELVGAVYARQPQDRSRDFLQCSSGLELGEAG